jgi:hypothetical protein
LDGTCAAFSELGGQTKIFQLERIITSAFL